ncbi:MAG: hypothetical protein NVSMB21_24720 [Vulcanimicrobiaceae bacterium]
MRDAGSHEGVSTDPPFCSEPAIYARERTEPRPSVVAAMPPGRMRERAMRARARFEAVRSAHPERIVAALGTLDEALRRDAARSATAASIERFRDEARDFATTMNGYR